MRAELLQVQADLNDALHLMNLTAKFDSTPSRMRQAAKIYEEFASRLREFADLIEVRDGG